MAASPVKRRHKVRRRADMSLLGGIRPPIAVLSVLLLSLAAITALGLGRTAQDRVPEAVLTSQQQFAEDGAIALRASIDESFTDLGRTAGLFNAADPVSPDAVLDKISSVYQKWTGTAVVEISSGKLLAARGENVPLTAIDTTKLSGKDALGPRMVKLANGETRLLSFALLSWPGAPQQLLVASSNLRFPGISLGQFRSIAVIDADADILSSDGIPQPEQLLTDTQRADAKRADKQLKSFAKTASVKVRQHPMSAKEPGSGGFPGVSGSLLGSLHTGDRSVAGYASLAGVQPGEPTVATGLGLSVVAMVAVAENPTTAAGPFFGLVAAGALVVVGALAVALLLGTVQRPLIRLFLESRRLTRGDLTRPVSVPSYGEAARIGNSLERLRRQLLGEDRSAEPPRRGRFGTRGLILVCGVLVLAWCGPMLLLLNRADDTAVVPQQLVNDQRERTDTLTDRVRRALNEGQADLLSVATLIGADTSPADMRTVLERTRLEHDRYQSLYVVDTSGKVVAQAGDTPQQPAGKASSQLIRVLNDSGKKPVIAAQAGIPGRDGATVVGEFRIDFLNGLLKRPGLGQINIVDDKQRIIGGNTGYRAFQELPGERLRTLVTGTNQKTGVSMHPSGILYRDGGKVQIAAAAPFVGGGAAKTLGWTVVSRQPASSLAIPEYRKQNLTVLAGLLGMAAAIACLGWLHIIVVRPLRALADQAEALAGGERRTVLYPRHHDEVGAVTRSLELVRQQLPAQQKREPAPTAPTTYAERT
ncbi:HAMP domain-containing protein [Streptomyces laculatispora]|uniref:HAMP domain-containing protein n=2 Tax=Streptomyces laculatispora TaxID=887464 RepID=A0ABY9I719_9ACTN|nr:HAMP domain-containing protein [Streptomyces laculatispora]WLQ42666.1 HAMP domain-containing protein [Streptomyces laculatispora]